MTEDHQPVSLGRDAEFHFRDGSQLNAKTNNVDEDDEIPPGCEELLSSINTNPTISLSLKQHNKSALIGVEFIMEVNNQAEVDLKCVSPTFFMCLLCDKRCTSIDHTISHLESASHRLSYLSKYFPQTFSLFYQAGQNSENWSPEIHQFLDAIVTKIERVMGRLEAFSCHRCQWDVKAQHFRTKINLGTHFKETPDLDWRDIKSPFFSTDVTSSTLVATSMTKVLPNEFCLPSTEVKEAKSASGEDKETKCLSNEESDVLVEKVVMQVKATEDRDVLLEKIVTQVQSPTTRRYRSSSKSRSPNRTKPYYSRSRSRSPRRRHSDSPEFRPSTRLRKRDLTRSRHSYYQHDDRDRFRWYSSNYVPPHENQRGRKNYSKPYHHRSPTPERNDAVVRKDCSRQKMREELEAIKLLAYTNRKQYQAHPESHPHYREEWEKYYLRRSSELRLKGKNPAIHNFKQEWLTFWNSRVKKLEKEEVKTKKIELKRKYEFADNESRATPLDKEPTPERSAESRKPVQFGWNKNKNVNTLQDLKSNEKQEPVSLSRNGSSEQPKAKAANTPKFVPVFNPICMSPSKTGLSSDPEIVQVLRTLAALETSLKREFVGPKIITTMLSRALAAERQKIGSSIKLLQDDSSCINLLDTSKEILKGLISNKLLNEAHTKSATQAVEEVARLLKNNPPPPTYNLASLVANLQATGLLQVLPELPSVHPASFKIGSIYSNVHSANTFSDLNKSFQDEHHMQSSSKPNSQQSNIKLNADELKVLIFHFRTLTVSQQYDLINFLRRLEENYSSMNRNQLPHSTNHPSSPLSKKFRHCESDMNPSAPTRRYPAIQEITGLSEKDLENFGIPLNEIDAPHPSNEEDSPRTIPSYRIDRISEQPFRSPPVDPRKQFSNSRMPIVNNSSQIPCQQQRSPLSTDRQQTESIYANQQLNHLSPTTIHNAQPNPSSTSPGSNIQEMSFCNELLDPRRNRRLYQETSLSRNIPLDQLDPLMSPIRIPTSPVAQFQGRQGQMENRIKDLCLVFGSNNPSQTSPRPSGTVGHHF